MEGHALAVSFFAASCPSPPHCDTHRHVLSILAAKAATLSRFNAEYPGYGGFLPWYKIDVYNRSAGIAPTDDWQNRVPALDNGQMAWALLAVSASLTLAGEAALADVYATLLQRMADNALRVFYDADRGVHRDVTRISNARLPPDQALYTAEGSGCLCDPYEGELFVFFADLYGNWSALPRGARDGVWTNRRAMLQVQPLPPTAPSPLTPVAGRKIHAARRQRVDGAEGFLVQRARAVEDVDAAVPRRVRRRARRVLGRRGRALLEQPRALHPWPLRQCDQHRPSRV